MLARRALWVFIGVVSVLVVAGASLLGWVLLRPQRTAPISLVVIGDDARLRLIEAGGTERLLASDANVAQFRFPAIAPDGRQLVYVAGDDSAMSVQRLDLVTGQRHELYRSNVNRPFNAAWSPDGRYINFLLLSSNGLSMHIVPVDGSEPARLIATGESSYYAWKRDGSELLLHLDGHSAQGGHLDTYRPDKQRAEPIASDPGLFQAPAWSLDGNHFFYVAQPPISSAHPVLADLESQIVRSSADGKDTQPLVSEKQSYLRIVRGPSSNQLAYVSARLEDGAAPHWGALKLIDGDRGGDVRTLSRADEQVVAFFWSPDGARIAYLTHSGTFAPDGDRTWHTVDLATGSLRDYATFSPSQSFAELQSYFDAYLFSFSPWSPDGQRLAYGTRDGVYVLDTAAGATSRVADGLLGMWVGGH